MRRVRVNAGMEQGEFASVIGVSKGLIGQQERAERPPRKGFLPTMIALRFNVDEHWLLTGCECREAETCRLTVECSAVELRGTDVAELYRRATTDAALTLALTLAD